MGVEVKKLDHPSPFPPQKKKAQASSFPTDESSRITVTAI